MSPKKKIRRFTHLNRPIPKGNEAQSTLAFRVMVLIGNLTEKIIMNFDPGLGQIKLLQLAEEPKIWDVLTVDEVRTLELSCDDPRTIKLIFNTKKKDM